MGDKSTAKTYYRNGITTSDPDGTDWTKVDIDCVDISVNSVDDKVWCVKELNQHLRD